MINLNQIKAIFKNTRYLYLSEFVQTSNLPAGTVMSGVLPGTKLWRKHYPETEGIDVELLWRIFRRRHDVAQERAAVLRDIAKDEAPILEGEFGKLPISLRRSDILMVGCVGGSLKGASIGYMDILVIYPAKGSPEIELGPITNERDGFKEYDDFYIKLDPVCTLSKDNIALLNYNSKIMEEARETCPKDLLGWLETLQKIRLVDTLKVDTNAKQWLGVSTLRKRERKKGKDHPIKNVQGRAFAHYDRALYEPILKASGAWDKLSLAARYPYFIHPKTVWDKAFSDLTPAERQIVENALLDGNAATDHAEKILNYLEAARAKEWYAPATAAG